MNKVSICGYLIPYSLFYTEEPKTFLLVKINKRELQNKSINLHYGSKQKEAYTDLATDNHTLY